MNKKKIAVMHILPSLDVGGMENGVVNLVNNMDRNVFRPLICCLEKEGRLRSRIKEDVKVFNLEENPGLQIKLPLELMRLFRNEKIDIVHTHNYYTSIYGTIGACLARTPVIIHGEHGMVLREEKARRKIVAKILANFTDVIICVSEDLRTQLSERTGISKKKIIAIANGIDFSLFEHKRDDLVKGEDIGIDKNDLVIGTVGRLVAVKDYETLIKAFSLVVKAIPNAKLMFAGDGPLAEELGSLVKKLKIEEKVIFLGHHNDVHKLYKFMNVFVLSSLSEGMSNVILEAMASSVPVVATKVGSNPELIENGRNGFLVSVGDKIELARSIIGILSNPAEANKMGQAGFKRVQDSFTIDKMVNGYEKTYLCYFEKKVK